ncbi:hypothetical protein FLA_1011 [Filimonas lacunae]|nr:hypothetical protein FLA_1011 [Filimonas lacunae]
MAGLPDKQPYFEYPQYAWHIGGFFIKVRCKRASRYKSNHVKAFVIVITSSQ